MAVRIKRVLSVGIAAAFFTCMATVVAAQGFSVGYQFQHLSASGDNVNAPTSLNVDVGFPVSSQVDEIGQMDRSRKSESNSAFSAMAQGASRDRESHWGVSVTVAPSWQARQTFLPLFERDPVVGSGSDFEIGFVHGRDLGGEWGVSLAWKRFKDGLTSGRVAPSCLGPLGCVLEGTVYATRDTSLFGLSVHKFVPFVTIKRRAQVGLNFAGGIAQVRGQADRHVYGYEFVNDPRGLTVGVTPTDHVDSVDAREIFISRLKSLPLFKIEVAGAALIAPGLKVRVGAGLNLPSYSAVSVSVSYLIGAK